MTDQQQAPESFILIEFAGIDSANFAVKPHNVSPAQVLMVASYLEIISKSSILELRESSKIAIPKKEEVGKILR